MIWKRTVPISEQMYENSKRAMRVFRLFGLLPMVTHRTQTHLYLKLSPLCVIYSFVLGIALIVLAYLGLLEDTFAERAQSVRIKSRTEMYVVFCDVTVVELVVCYGIFLRGLDVSKFFDYVSCLNGVDLIIPPENVKSSKNLENLILVGILLVGASMLTADQLMYLNRERDIIEKISIIKRYFPFYVSYLILMMSQCQFWNLAHSILRRLKRLNGHLQTGQVNDAEDKSTSRSPPEFSNSRLNYIIDTLNRKNQPISKVEPKTNHTKMDQVVELNNIGFLKLASAYVCLCDAVDFLNHLMGAMNAITIVGILWHLIETPFHVLTELGGERRNAGFIAMNATWCVFHLGRLLVLVEPCNSCKMEVQKTQNAVCKMLCSTDISREKKAELETFAITLVQSKLEFSAGGLTAIDRSLVTALLGTITTYLVILLQYQNS